MTSFTLSPYRFTSDVPRMVAFLEAVGLQPSVTSPGLRFAVMVAEHGGQVGVHESAGSEVGAPSGETQLVFAVDCLEAAASTLRRAGLDVVTWDESYGRHAGVIDPSGGGIWINEEQDRYGYQTHQVTPGGGVAVTSVRYTRNMSADQAFFASFGFTATPPPGVTWWV